jgi:Mannose-1-phosphate guanylyltransferase
MEKATNIKMVSAHFDWSDLGTWRTLKSIYPEDSDNNIIVGNALAHKATVILFMLMIDLYQHLG